MRRGNATAGAWAITLILATGTALGQHRSPVAEVGGHFGLHGPTYSHMLHDRGPLLWQRGEIILDVLDDTRVGWLRQDFWWSLAEPEQGRFEWSDFDRAIDAYNQHGFRLFAILCYSSAWSNGVCPQTDEERARFANYVYEMVQRYQGKVAAWEIWNEPNIQPFWSPRPDPKLYAKLLIAAYDAAKRADPDCVIVGGGLAGPDAEFLEGMYAHGAAGHFDVFSYHNYGQQSSMESEWPAVEKLRAVMAKYDEPDKPIWHTESGFFTGPVGVPEDQQGAWIVRYSVGLLALGIEKTFQLTLHDWTDDPQHHDLSVYRGITHADLSRKPSFDVYRTMCARLNGKRLEGVLRPAEGVSGFLFKSPEQNESVLVLWRDDWGAAEPVSIDLDTPLVLVQQADGDTRRLESDSGVYALPIGGQPVYVFNPGPAMTRKAWLRWANPVMDRVPRSDAATISVRLNCSSDREVQFAMAPRAEELGEVKRVTVPHGNAAIDYVLDTSHLEPGPHEVHWALWPTEGEPEEPLASGLRRIEVASPLQLSFGQLKRLDAARPDLPVRIAYHGDRPTDARVTLQLNGQPSGEPLRFDLLPGEDTEVSVPLDLAALRSTEPAKIAVSLEAADLTLNVASNRRLIAAPSAPTDARIDGELGEWTALPPQITPAMLSWEYVNAVEEPAANDLAVRAWVAHDDRGLWLALEARDDVIDPPQGRAVWNWDSLQVGLDMGGDARSEDKYDANDFEIELGYQAGGDPWCYLGYCPLGWPAEQLTEQLDAAVTIDRETGLIRYELLIPASLLVSSTRLEPDTVMGFSILVNDNDGTGRAGWQQLTPGIGLGKHPAEFAWLWLR